MVSPPAARPPAGISGEANPPVTQTIPADDARSPEISSPRQSIQHALTIRNGITLRGVAFDSRDHRLIVVDQSGGPGSMYADAEAVARSHHAVAVINAGFFTPDGKPLGMVVSEGAVARSGNNSSSLGSAVWHEDRAGRSAIVRNTSLGGERRLLQHNLLQAGPFLLEHGRPVGGLENQKRSARTFLLWDGGQRWWLGISSPVSLAALAETLAAQPPTPWKPATAMNLDGGRSSELWVTSALAGTTTHIRPPWNRPVRNFLALLPRH